MTNDNKDFLDKLDDELESMTSSSIKKVEANIAARKEKRKQYKNNNNFPEVVIESVLNKKTETKTTTEVKNKSYNKPKRLYSKNTKTDKFNRREKFVSKFPETRFYLPSLREKHTRYIPIG